MSEVRLVVREAMGDWSGTIHGSCADRAIAALSADPVTMEELEAATGRFVKRKPGWRFFGNLSPGLRAEPYDAGLVVIDLVARLVVVDSSYSSPGPEGTVEYHNGHCCTRTSLRYHLADDWLFERDGDLSEYLSEKRRRTRAAKPNLDARPVFYGRPMLEYVGRQCFSAFARRDANAADEQIQQIHAAWLLTPRDDLAGARPREVALDRHRHITWDLQDRCDQWSFLGECPPGLLESSHAFQYGGFGTHEMCLYYDLVRHLLWSCWDQLTELASSPTVGPRFESYTAGDFLTTEVRRLETVRETWLDTPDPEFHRRTPRSMILRERARVPEAVFGHDAMADPDCPCCQMMADIPGPMFWHLDGCNMDDDFAFDISHRTHEEWEKEQRSMEEFNKHFAAERSERERLGVTEADRRADDSHAVWSRSFCVKGTADVPLGVRVFSLGCHLAELIVGLRAGADRETVPAATQRHIDQLNRDFGNLRELLQSPDSELADALIDPVLRRFADTLDAVATARAELVAQCESLTNELNELLNPPSSDPTVDFSDPDLPF